MMKRVAVGVAWISAALAVVAFFLPWAHLDVREPSLMKHVRTTTPVGDVAGSLTKGVGRIAVKIRRGAETITGDLPSLKELPRQVGGVQIPQLANSEHAKLATAIFELFTRSSQQLGLKSYAVYLVPGLALIAALVLTLLGTRLAVVISVGSVCAMIAGVGCWKLLTTNTQSLFVAITIGRGLWLSLWAYVGLALAALLMSVCGASQRD